MRFEFAESITPLVWWSGGPIGRRPGNRMRPGA